MFVSSTTDTNTRTRWKRERWSRRIRSFLGRVGFRRRRFQTKAIRKKLLDESVSDDDSLYADDQDSLGRFAVDWGNCEQFLENVVLQPAVEAADDVVVPASVTGRTGGDGESGLNDVVVEDKNETSVDVSSYSDLSVSRNDDTDLWWKRERWSRRIRSLRVGRGGVDALSEYVSW